MSIDLVLKGHNVQSGGFVRSVNGKQGDVIIDHEDVGAAPAEHVHEISDVRELQENLELLDTTNEYLSDMNRKTVTLAEGTHVVSSETSALVDVEIEGRTLTSMANSNLEGDKYYVIADPKTKIGVDKVVVSGVGRFKKRQTTKTVADFKEKIEGNALSNPHSAYRSSSITRPPSENTAEFNRAQYQSASDSDGSLISNPYTVANINSGQMFSFNVVEQVERELGIIPKETLSGKVQWIKDNLLKAVSVWNGFGSSPSGNKSSYVWWNVPGQTWSSIASHGLDVVGSISRSLIGDASSSFIDDEGFIHFLAYAEPSDGTTPSVINTDYVSLDIELRHTAQLNTRGKIIRVENFEDKISGSSKENPNMIRYSSANSLQTPSQLTNEMPQAIYDRVNKQGDSPLGNTSVPNSGNIAQQIFSFNVIEAVERNIGKIPAVDTTGKVAWLKNNIPAGENTSQAIIFNWIGYGSSFAGNKANVLYWGGTQWQGPMQHTASSPTLISRKLGWFSPNFIQPDGFIHLIAYSEPSDGITVSTIYTDYIEVEIELKPTADFHAPRVPLYEVTKDEYDKIGLAWDANEVIRRYPVVEGTQHLTNPYLVAEGDNLLPPFTEWDVLHANARIISPYEMELDATSIWQQSLITIPAIPNQDYCLSYEGEHAVIRRLNSAGVVVGGNLNQSNFGSTFFSFRTTPDTVKIQISAYGSDSSHDVRKFLYKNFSLTLGSEPKPFAPRNPSYLQVQEKLGAIGDKKDVLFKEDGKWKKLKNIKSMILDSSLGYTVLRFEDYNRITVKLGSVAGVMFTMRAYNNFGESIRELGWNEFVAQTFDTLYFSTAEDKISIHLSDGRTGWFNNLRPTSSDMKRYFNGWKYTDGITWNSVTGNGQTATAQQALDTQPTDYTPYKLSYVLAEPIVEEVEVEGQIKVDGLTQVEVASGIVVREKANPALAGVYYINAVTVPASWTKQKSFKILDIFKNGVSDMASWVIKKGPTSYGLERAELDPNLYDNDAEYSITYLVDDKHQFTNAPTNVRLTYANSIRSSFQDLVRTVEDTSTQVSVDSNFLIDLLVELKAMRGTT